MQNPLGQPMVLSWLCPLPASCQPQLCLWGTELRSKESLDALQALFSNTSNTGVLSAQLQLQAGKMQAVMEKLTPSQPAPAHSFISKCFLSFSFFFLQCSYLLSSFPLLCIMIVPRPLLHSLYGFSRCCLSQKKFVTSSVYFCTQAGRKWGAM